MDAPLSLYLARFHAADDASTPVAPAAPPVERVSPAGPPPAEPVVTLTVATLEARIAAAGQAASDEAATVLADALATASAAREVAVAEALAGARRTWAEQEGRAAAAALEALPELRELMAAKLADVLRPLLARALAERTRAALVGAIDRILDDPDQPCLTLTGPADLLESIRAARPGREDIAFVVAATVDVVVAAKATHIATRLAAALADLSPSVEATTGEDRP